MMDPRPKTEQPKEPAAPAVVTEPSTTAAPTKPIASPQSKGPVSGGTPPLVAKPKDPAQVPTQTKP